MEPLVINQQIQSGEVSLSLCCARVYSNIFVAATFLAFTFLTLKSQLSISLLLYLLPPVFAFWSGVLTLSYSLTKPRPRPLRVSQLLIALGGIAFIFPFVVLIIYTIAYGEWSHGLGASFMIMYNALIVFVVLNTVYFLLIAQKKRKILGSV
jgi:hypothetical protein